MSAFVIHTIEFLPVVSSVNSSDFFLNKPSSIYRVLLIRTSLITLVSDCVLLTYSSESSFSILTQISPVFPISSSFSACSGSRVWTLATPSLPLYQTRGTLLSLLQLSFLVHFCKLPVHKPSDSWRPHIERFQQLGRWLHVDRSLEHT